MHPGLFQLSHLLAQAAGAPQPANPRPASQMRFSDLQKGFRSHLNGETPDYSYLLWAIALAVILFGALLHLRQRRKTGGPPSSPAALFREIAREVPFPFGTRILLHWVARSAQVPAATLLISDKAFQKSVHEWSQQPTFTLVRQWGAARLSRLQKLLFHTP
jgi:hypothetical protein